MKGFGGLPGNLQGMMKQAQKMQEDLQKAQEQMESVSVEGTSGGGMVKITANGKHEVQTVIIDPQIASSGDVEMLQDLLVAAFNDVSRKVKEMMKSELGKVTGGVSIPGLF